MDGWVNSRANEFTKEKKKKRHELAFCICIYIYSHSDGLKTREIDRYHVYCITFDYEHERKPRNHGVDDGKSKG